ncbi:MAG: TerB family tellurite resistance protein [Bacteroidales bacterium]|nr:TerB family tellurite resistance protein [Bacteroidales bacterium]
MKTNIQNIAAFLASAIWADETYDEAEKIAVEEVEEGLELEGLAAAIDAEIEKIKDLDGQAVAEYIAKAGEGVDDEEIAIVFEAVLQVMLCDGVFAYSEANNLLSVADALGLEHEYALLMAVDMVKDEPEMEIEFE